MPGIINKDCRGKRECRAMHEHHLHYSILIEWSDEDQVYLVTLPEWADRVMMPATHGSTYTEAAQNGQEVLEMLVSSASAEGQPPPKPKTHVAA